MLRRSPVDRRISPKKQEKMGPPASDDLVDVLFTLDESQAQEGSTSIFLTDFNLKLHHEKYSGEPPSVKHESSTSVVKTWPQKKSNPIEVLLRFVPKFCRTIQKLCFFQKYTTTCAPKPTCRSSSSSLLVLKALVALCGRRSIPGNLELGTDHVTTWELGNHTETPKISSMCVQHTSKE